MGRCTVRTSGWPSVRPGHAEVITGDGRCGLQEVEQAALCAAEALRTRGVAAGDRVLLAVGNSSGYVVALLALMHLDASIVLVDHRAGARERRDIAERSGAGWLVHDDPGRAADAGPAASGDRRRARSSPCPPHSVDLSELVATGRAGARELGTAAWRRRRDALVGWSSGTTGEPKGIVRSGAAVLDNIRSTADRMGYRPDDVLLPLLPFSHQYGLSLVLLCWTVRCGLVIPPHTRLDHALRFAAQAGVTVLDAPPATYHSLLRLLDAGAGTGLATVRMYCVGGAPLGRQLAQDFRRRTGQPLLDGYGSTEVGNIALASLAHPVGCGRPLDGVELWIGTEDGREAAAGTVGEVSVRTPGLLTGYLGPRGVVQPFRADHYRTGDLGYRDAAGNVFVVGRKHAVHRLGYTLYPEALAAAAEGCGQPVRVVPVPDERLGHRLVFVVQDDTGQDARHWRRLITPHLEAHAQPNLVVVVDALPVNRNGKTDTAALQQLVWRALERPGPHPGDPTAPPDDTASPDSALPNTAPAGTGCRPQHAPACAPTRHGGTEPGTVPGTGTGTGTGTGEGCPGPP